MVVKRPNRVIQIRKSWSDPCHAIQSHKNVGTRAQLTGTQYYTSQPQRRISTYGQSGTLTTLRTARLIVLRFRSTFLHWLKRCKRSLSQITGLSRQVVRGDARYINSKISTSEHPKVCLVSLYHEVLYREQPGHWPGEPAAGHQPRTVLARAPGGAGFFGPYPEEDR